MATLDQYLTDGFHSDQRDVAEVERIIQDTCDTLIRSFNDRLGWPYKIEREHGPRYREAGLSHSTTAMVLLALHRISGDRCQPKGFIDAPQFPSLSFTDKLKEEIERTQTAATALLVKAIGPTKSTDSGTYGKDDPITLSYLSSLCLSSRKDEQLKAWQPLTNYVADQTAELSKVSPEVQQSYFQPPDADIVSNTFLPLRVVQSIRAARGDDFDPTLYRKYFESALHDQLSFSSIPDSRFDPAELAFCLEGLLLTQRNAVDPTLLTRVFEVMARAQQESASWRPTKPFLASERGMALFPISVEVANSLLRSCEISDERKLHDTSGSANIGLFRRYWQWLRARTVRFKHNNTTYVGWHSEHVNDPSLLHVWETSQVIEFLLNYRRLLQAHIARTTLILSRFTTRSPDQDKKGIAWSQVVKDFEPVNKLGGDYKIYSRLEGEFVTGWTSGSPKSYSLLLYGPPGTGKTTVAENLADALSFRMITITVSDFLAGGGAQIEARAKAIFDVLQSQSECVVLFDEIDNFLLDRDSERYSRQDSVFQFMTPGMLTKLNDLRRSKRVLFVVATNYENRIDLAIKRPGRIDHKYLVLPPDAIGRRRIITKVMKDLPEKRGFIAKDFTEEEWRKLTDASVFLGFKDIEGAVLQVHRSQPTVVDLASKLKNRGRTTDLSKYANKFGSTEQVSTNSVGAHEEAPMEEFLCLLGLALESQDPDFQDAGAIQKAAKHLVNGQEGKSIEGLVKSKAPGLETDVMRSVASVLAQHLPDLGSSENVCTGVQS